MCSCRHALRNTLNSRMLISFVHCASLTSKLSRLRALQEHPGVCMPDVNYPFSRPIVAGLLLMPSVFVNPASVLAVHWLCLVDNQGSGTGRGSFAGPPKGFGDSAASASTFRARRDAGRWAGGDPTREEAPAWKGTPAALPQPQARCRGDTDAPHGWGITDEPDRRSESRHGCPGWNPASAHPSSCVWRWFSWHSGGASCIPSPGSFQVRYSGGHLFCISCIFRDVEGVVLQE